MSRVRTYAAAAVAAVAVCACGAGVRGAETSTPACREHLGSRQYSRAANAVHPLVRPLQRGLRAPGLQVAVAVDGKVVWRVACGFADVRTKRLVGNKTRFRIGSVTKSLTAVALARLAERGRVDVDAAIQRYVPQFPRKEEGEITLRELAGHLAGIRHYESTSEVVNRRRFASLGDALSIFADDPLVAKPRQRFSYSSYGFVLIGAALETAAQASYEALMMTYVLDPAGMTNTRLGTRPHSGSATFYEVTDRGGFQRAPAIDLSDRLPAAGYVSTASDLARFGSTVAGSRLVGAAGRALLFTPQKTLSGISTSYGVGFELRGPSAGHTGSVVGGTAALLIHRPSHAAIALTTNLGYVTAASPPPPAKGTPDPPQLLLPFVKAKP